ncbi:hypothetical protein J3R30DRAFT_3460584 [Lentinula aciculospora]|uniref:Ribosomal RNA methyltransferase FtsJ domain-containing protein n=1 Tax=Lentinula aciculospora TaxID=153920 RepID=A0A9W9AIG8_9AGAR|nr:hypothetical protein J3R30DRAFT_3460584 [Lentinula aciculospora]
MANSESYYHVSSNINLSSFPSRGGHGHLKNKRRERHAVNRHRVHSYDSMTSSPAQTDSWYAYSGLRPSGLSVRRLGSFRARFGTYPQPQQPEYHWDDCDANNGPAHPQGTVVRSGHSECYSSHHGHPVPSAARLDVREYFQTSINSKHSGHPELSSKSPQIVQKGSVHWDKALADTDSEMRRVGGTATLTRELIAYGARELKEIFEIWEECREKACNEGTTPILYFIRQVRDIDLEANSYCDVNLSPLLNSNGKGCGQYELEAQINTQQGVFQELVNRFSRLFPGPHVYEEEYYFLDVGCRPGGFASFLLSRNTKAIGVGICPLPSESLLPVDYANDSKITTELESYYCTRHQTHFASFDSKLKLYFVDIAKLDLRPPGEKYRRGLFNTNLNELTPDCSMFKALGGHSQLTADCLVNVDSDLKRLPKELLFGLKQKSDNRHIVAGASSKKFNLVVLDSYSSSPSLPTSPDLLLITQLLIALQSLTPNGGGTLVVRLRHPESVVTAKILYMLDTLSSTVAAIKPRDMLGDSEDPGCFYAIAQNVGGGPHGYKLLEDIEELRRLWWKLMIRSASEKILSKSDTTVVDMASREEIKGETGEIEIGEISEDSRESPAAMNRGMCGLKDEDFDFIICTHELYGLRDDYLARLTRLGELVWTRQLEMILMATRNNRK